MELTLDKMEINIEEEMLKLLQEEMENNFWGMIIQQNTKMYVLPNGSTETHLYEKDSRLLVFRKNNPTKIYYSRLLHDEKYKPLISNLIETI